MNTKTMKLSELNPAEYNPRVKLEPGMPDFEKLKRSIQEFGYVDPIIVNADGTIIGGHQRFFVLKDLGWEKVECVVVDLSKDREKALNIALNKVSGEWDEDKLKDLLIELDAEQFDLSLTGFDEAELHDILGDISLDDDVEEDDYDFEKEVPAKAKRGDVYQLGDHRLMCGDSSSEEDVKLLAMGGLSMGTWCSPIHLMVFQSATKTKCLIPSRRQAK